MYAERDAISAVQEPDFTACAKRNGLRTSIEVQSNKRNGEAQIDTIRARDVYAAWLTFRQQPDIAESLRLCTLTGVVEPVARRFMEWLTTRYTPRYQRITKQEHRVWLTAIAALCVQRRIMEAKYRSNAFLDDTSRVLMSTAMEAAKHYQEIAKVAHRVVRSYPPLSADEIRRIFLNEAEDFWRTQFARLQRATPTPLPPLPARTSADLLALPEETSTDDTVEGGLW